MKKIHCVPICSRVNLYFSDAGFRFYQSMTPRSEIQETDFFKWDTWQYHYPPYTRDNVKGKVESYLDTLPERAKCHTFYQAIVF